MDVKGREVRAMVADLKFEECPTSILSRNPEMNVLTQEILDMKWLKEATGATMFGPDASEWDARLFHAIRLGEIEDRRVESARDSVTE